MDSFPKEILEYVNGLSFLRNDIGRSSDLVYIFEDKYILKISDNKERLLNEKNKIDYLENKLPVPKSILFMCLDDKYYYLRTNIIGKSLIDERFINNPELLINILIKAVKLIRKLDDINIPFKSSDNSGSSFVHGDLCLPNILVSEDNEIAGFIDLDNCGLGDAWYDYSWLLWSLEYNLKTNQYNQKLLNSLGIEFDEEKFNKYIPESYR